MAGLFAGKTYTNTLSQKCADVLYINLVVPYKVLKYRVETRDHFVPKEILDLGWTRRGWLVAPGPNVDGNQPLESVVDDVLRIIDKHH